LRRRHEEIAPHLSRGGNVESASDDGHGQESPQHHEALLNQTLEELVDTNSSLLNPSLSPRAARSSHVIGLEGLDCGKLKYQSL
jgi:hypothetical protein